MAKQPAQFRRKLLGLDEEIWHGLNLLSRESMKSFQELADEAFRDLLQKYGRPTNLKVAAGERASFRYAGYGFTTAASQRAPLAAL
jgi:hypothetical protein